jgi:hypothetical protein
MSDAISALYAADASGDVNALVAGAAAADAKARQLAAQLLPRHASDPAGRARVLAALAGLAADPAEQGVRATACKGVAKEFAEGLSGSPDYRPVPPPTHTRTYTYTHAPVVGRGFVFRAACCLEC